MESDACLVCRFGSIKIQITLPEKYSSSQVTEETRKFASKITAVSGEKPIHYDLKFEAGQDCLKEPSYSAQCSCILNVKKRECSKFRRPLGKDCKVVHLSFAKTPKIELTH